VKLTIPGWPVASKNGVASIASEGQRARMNDLDRALRGEKTWKGVSKALGVPIFALAASTFVLAARPPQVAVYYAEPNGLEHYVGDAQGAITPTELTVESSIVTFIRDLREIPGVDYRLVDRNTGIAHRMVAPMSPAERDVLGYWKQYNPKARGRDVTRLLADRNPVPSCTRQGNTLTFGCSWAETIQDRTGLTTVERLGSVTLAGEPTLSPDRGSALDNPGGVSIYSVSPSLVTP
jgi:hypothetical protein